MTAGIAEQHTPRAGGVEGADAGTALVLPLAVLRRADAASAGGKAATLGALLQAGFPVPDGFVLTTSAFERFLAANGLAADSPPDAVAQATLPADVLDTVLATARERFHDEPLAVRSSAVAEDLADASFAGQYETVLGVRGPEALTDAVRRVWASAFTERVAAYRSAQGQAATGVAVLIQRLVPAEAAGVAFTANPVTGDRGEVVVSAVKGLGERLVSGAASADEWTVRGEEARCVAAPERAVEEADVRAIASLARRVEAALGGAPQDVEWAMAGGELFLLQARPITALREPAPAPVPVPVDPPPGYWERAATHYPRPVSPMARSILGSADAFRQAFAELGLLIETMDTREIGGWMYHRVVPLGGKDAPAPPAWLMPLLIRAVPMLRERIKQCVRAVREDTPGQYARRWYEEWLPGLERRIRALRDVDLAALTDRALDEHVGRVATLFEDAKRVHFQVAIGAIAPMTAELAFACRDLLGWDERQTLELLGGLSERSSEPARKLAELARLADERPAVRELLDRAPVTDAVAARLHEADAGFARAFAQYQRQYGVRALRYDPAEVTLGECPGLLLGLIRGQLAQGYDAAEDAAVLARRRSEVKQAALASLAARPTDRARFERLLARAEQAYPLREDSEFFTVSAPLALIRFAALEIGRRLVRRGQIDRQEDVFWLEIDEARAALRGEPAAVSGEPGQLRALVTRRKGERAWVEAHPGPVSYGKAPGAPPSLKPLPPEARLLMEAVTWFIGLATGPGRVEEAHGTATGPTALRGIGASPGSYTGTVRVVRSEDEFGKLQAGDVLVCPITSPVWSVLFPVVGALVTDAGGVLSHPAIIAREYRVPAVVATGNGTAVLRDGQRVTVDGTAGTVEALS